MIFEGQISPPVLSALAVILGALIGVGGQLTSARLQRHRERMALRRGLQVELESMWWVEGTELYTLKNEIKNGDPLTHTYVPTQIYDTKQEKIGLLSKPERMALIRYYQAAHIAQDQLNRIDDSDTDSSSIREKFTDRTLPELKSRRERAVSQVSARTTFLGRLRTRFANFLEDASYEDISRSS